MCPDWESNQQPLTINPFGSQAGTQATEPHQPGQEVNLLLNHHDFACHPITWKASVIFTISLAQKSSHVACSLDINSGNRDGSATAILLIFLRMMVAKTFLYTLQFIRSTFVPWLVWLSGLSVGLQTKGSPVRFQVRAHAWVVGQFSSRECLSGNHTGCFSSSLSPSLFLSLRSK